MSAFITPIAPISVDTAFELVAGTFVEVTAPQSIVATDPNDVPNQPVEIIVLSVDSAEDVAIPILIGSGTEGADIIIDGDGDGTIEIGNAVDANGNTLSASGTTFQVAEDYQGTVIANLDGAITDGTKVDLNTETTSGNTIADALGVSRLSDALEKQALEQLSTDFGKLTIRNFEWDQGSPEFIGFDESTAFAKLAPRLVPETDYYINTGAADDQVGGSQGNDFIRLGAGDDTFNAESGDDIVRMGSGNDFGSLGDGDDIAYFTVDQLQGDQTKVITDFDAAGDDKIQINGDIAGLIDINGLGTNSLVIELSGEQSGTTTIISEGESFNIDDIEFVFPSGQDIFIERDDKLISTLSPDTQFDSRDLGKNIFSSSWSISY